jgi:glycosyltransferase involved in cell wall biosynthesis
MTCRLLYLVGQTGGGGLERQLYHLLQTIDRERYRPAVAVWNPCEDDIYGPRIRALGIPLHAFPRQFSAAAKLEKFRRLVRELKPEVVHSYSFYTNFAAYWAARGTQAVALGSIRSNFTLEKKAAGLWLGGLSSRWPRNQISNNFMAAETIRRSRSLFVPKRVSVVPNGLDLELFRGFPLATEERVCILGVGSLLPAKRWDRLLVAALEVKRRGLNCSIRIAGDGPLRGSLEQQAQCLGLTDCIEFVGAAHNIPELLAHARFLAHTSDNEGCPNVVMEAMACERAVVATDAGDVPQLIEDGKTGFVVRRGDDAMLVARMVTLITDHQLCQRMGAAGRARAERDFGLDRLVAETLAAYQDAGWRGT